MDDSLKACWEDLAQAIIMQAVKDYREAAMWIKRYPDYERAQKMLKDTESFFRSRWFAQLTDVNGEHLLRKLKEEGAA